MATGTESDEMASVNDEAERRQNCNKESALSAMGLGLPAASYLFSSTGVRQAARCDLQMCNCRPAN